MALCGNCGAESFRIRTVFHEEHGRYIGQRDECPQCAPGSFEPRWLRETIVPAFEAYPNQYRKVVAEDGRVSYEATDETNADHEAKMLRPPPEQAAAFRSRRAWVEGRPKQLTADQIQAAERRKLETLRKLRERGANV